MMGNNVGKYSDSQPLTFFIYFFFLGVRPDSVTGSTKRIFSIQTSTLCFLGNLGFCQAPAPANDDEMALLQSGRGVFSLLSPKVKPLTHPEGVEQGHCGSRTRLHLVKFHFWEPESEAQGVTGLKGSVLAAQGAGRGLEGIEDG